MKIATPYYLSASALKSPWLSTLSYLDACWKHRYLLGVFIQRDLKIKYAQTMIGMGWTLIQPLATALLYVVIFSSLFQPSNPFRYGLYVFSGVMAWGLFQYIVLQASAVLFHSEHLLGKLAFPRLLLIIAKAGTGLVDYVYHLAVLFVLLMLIEGVPSWRWLWILPASGLVVLLALSLALWISALSVRYRDWQHALPFVLHLGLWCTPVFYAWGDLQHGWGYALLPSIQMNPLAEPMELLRMACFADHTLSLPYWGLRSLIMILLALVGVVFFIRQEPYLEDVL